jgi:hypothetical protein
MEGVTLIIFKVVLFCIFEFFVGAPKSIFDLSSVQYYVEIQYISTKIYLPRIKADMKI